MFGENHNYNPELAETQQRFFEYYQQKLLPVYEKLEKERQTYLQILRRNILGVLGVFCSMIVLFYFDVLSSNVLETQWFSILCSILLLIAAYLISSPFLNYNEKTKSKAMNKILSFWGNFKYCGQKDLIGDDVIKKSELFSYFNSSFADDSFCGEYRGTSLDVSEHNVRIHGNKGDTIIFSGIMLMLDFPKPFKGQTVVLNKGRKWNFALNNPALMIALALMLSPTLMIYYYFFTEPGVPFGLLFTWLPIALVGLILGLIYMVYRRYNPKKTAQKVTLEGIPFLQKWKVMTDNQVEARYLLTPAFMEKMLEIKRLFRGKHIDFSFFDHKLLIAVHTRKDMFETTALFTSALSYHKIRDVVSQIYSIFAVIDVVLNSREK